MMDTSTTQTDQKPGLRVTHMGRTVTHMDTSEALDRQIIAEVRDAMKAAGLSQRDVADMAAIPVTTLARRLSGHGKGFTVQELLAVSTVLNVSLVELALRAERAIARSGHCAA